MLPSKFNLDDLSYLSHTSILSGEIGSGKTSFLVQLLLNLTRNPKSKVKNVFINIDGFNFEKFNEMSKVTFSWLDMSHLISFSKKERLAYTKYNSEGGGVIAENVRKDLEKDFDYFDSLIVCDESDHYLTKKDDDFANFMKFRRHYNIGIIFITQKFQNLNNSYYNSGAINRFYRIRNPLFNITSSKYLELWSSSNTAVSDNLVSINSFKIEPLVFELYDTGDNIISSKFVFKKFLIPIIFLVIGIPIAIYFLHKEYSDMTTDRNKDFKKKVVVNINKNLKKSELVIENSVLIKCISFGNYTNCYFDNKVYSLNSELFLKLKSLGLEYKKEFNLRNTYFYKVDVKFFDYMKFNILNPIEKKEKKVKE
ncbi:MAG: zonular occludens toxin domain-containing protein [Lutibacter sp.]|uniref:zonular occludens toxin domain-containing protein n=1 Tax=Lutibacter sp. TaxID=1925666 RepID=UPI00385BAE38